MTGSEKIKVLLPAGKTKCNFAFDSAIENRAAEIAGMLVEAGDFTDESVLSISQSDLQGARIQFNIGDGVTLHDLPLRLLANPPRDALFLPISLPKLSLSKSEISLPKASDKDRCIVFTFFFKKK